jgi:hypothetical protein
MVLLFDIVGRNFLKLRIFEDTKRGKIPASNSFDI